MCGCGRKRADAPTSVQAAEEAQLLRTLAEQTARDAEAYIQSQRNAIGNTKS